MIFHFLLLLLLLLLLVRDAYKIKGWTFTPAEIEQCSDQNFLTNLHEQFSEEGDADVLER